MLFDVINAMFNLRPGGVARTRFDTIVLIITQFSLCNENLELFFTFVHFWELTEGYNKSTFKKKS